MTSRGRHILTAAVIAGFILATVLLMGGILLLRGASEETRSAVASAAQALAALATLATVVVAAVSARLSAQSAADSERAARTALDALAGHRDMQPVVAFVAHRTRLPDDEHTFDNGGFGPDPMVTLTFSSETFVVHNLRARYEGGDTPIPSPSRYAVLEPGASVEVPLATRVGETVANETVTVEFDDPEFGAHRRGVITLQGGYGVTQVRHWEVVPRPRGL